MSTTVYAAVAQRLTQERLQSYLTAGDDTVESAIKLYDWNSLAAGALHEDIGRVEVVFRNTIDEALRTHGVAAKWPSQWYDRPQLFLGKQGERTINDVARAKHCADKYGRSPNHGRVIAELNFGFWRFLCTKTYLTSLWVPALAKAFPNHPKQGDDRSIREDVEDRIQRIHYLRNRIAHHEPIHQRDLDRDVSCMSDVMNWICEDTAAWITATSRSAQILRSRP